MEVFVIYDQFHWFSRFHLEVPATGKDNALSLYRFYKSCYPNISLGLKSLSDYKKFKLSILQSQTK